jgi:hypothetical protein
MEQWCGSASVGTMTEYRAPVHCALAGVLSREARQDRSCIAQRMLAVHWKLGIALLGEVAPWEVAPGRQFSSMLRLATPPTFGRVL